MVLNNLHLSFVIGGAIITRATSDSYVAIAQPSRLVAADGPDVGDNTNLGGKLWQGFCDGSILLSKSWVPIDMF